MDLVCIIGLLRVGLVLLGAAILFLYLDLQYHYTTNW